MNSQLFSPNKYSNSNNILSSTNYVHLGGIYDYYSDYADALDYYKRKLKKDPSNIYFNYRIALCYFLTNKYNSGCEYLEKAKSYAIIQKNYEYLEIITNIINSVKINSYSNHSHKTSEKQK